MGKPVETGEGALKAGETRREERVADPENAAISIDLYEVCGGEGGIRTPDTLASMPHFECGAFNHSATSPLGRAERRTQ